MKENHMADGLSIGTMFQNGLNSIQADGKSLQEKIKNLSSNKDGTIDQAEMLKVQFAMGQYNAKMEMISSITKSLQDMLKSLAQRTG
ncbi:MAG: type III secretion protein [Desulfovibrio sp.]|nr:type III secretion protein [Desulfovibrio sp.]